MIVFSLREDLNIEFSDSSGILIEILDKTHLSALITPAIRKNLSYESLGSCFMELLSVLKFFKSECLFTLKEFLKKINENRLESKEKLIKSLEEIKRNFKNLIEKIEKNYSNDVNCLKKFKIIYSEFFDSLVDLENDINKYYFKQLNTSNTEVEEHKIEKCSSLDEKIENSVNKFAVDIFKLEYPNEKSKQNNIEKVMKFFEEKEVNNITTFNTLLHRNLCLLFEEAFKDQSVKFDLKEI